MNYYEVPEQSVFDDIKTQAIALWNTYDNTYGYVTEKVNQIKDIENIKDNAWYIVAMFDSENQSKLLGMVQPETRRILKTILQEA